MGREWGRKETRAQHSRQRHHRKGEASINELPHLFRQNFHGNISSLGHGKSKQQNTKNLIAPCGTVIKRGITWGIMHGNIIMLK